MFRCDCCGGLFEQPYEYDEKMEYWGMPCYEHWSVSPCCSEGYEEYDEDEAYDDEEVGDDDES